MRLLRVAPSDWRPWWRGLSLSVQGLAVAFVGAALGFAGSLPGLSLLLVLGYFTVMAGVIIGIAGMWSATYGEISRARRMYRDGRRH